MGVCQQQGTSIALLMACSTRDDREERTESNEQLVRVDYPTLHIRTRESRDTFDIDSRNTPDLMKKLPTRTYRH